MDALESIDLTVEDHRISLLEMLGKAQTVVEKEAEQIYEDFEKMARAVLEEKKKELIWRIYTFFCKGAARYPTCLMHLDPFPHYNLAIYSDDAREQRDRLLAEKKRFLRDIVDLIAALLRTGSEISTIYLPHEFLDRARILASRYEYGNP